MNSNLSKFVLMSIVLAGGFAQAQIYSNPGRTYQQPIYQQPVQGRAIQGNTHWTQTLTPEKNTHDFGSIAKASKTEYTFEFENTLDCDVHLTNVRASCGCTIPTIMTSTVKPGETAKLHAKFDTMKFDGHRSATLSVSVRRDQPYTQYGEIQFSVKGHIRRDVVLQPTSVEFADVLSGNDAQRTVTVMYAGDPRWTIKEVRSSNPNINVEFKEVRRDNNARRVDYELIAKLNNEQSEGQFTGSLTIITNDLNSNQLAVDVSGKVLSVIQTTDVKLGVLNKGQKVVKSMIVRGKRPFEIQDVVVNNPAIKILDHSGEKTLHLVKYELDTSKALKINDEITFRTTDPNQPEAKLSFTAQVVPGTFAGGSND